MNGETIASILEKDPFGKRFSQGYLARDSEIVNIQRYPALFILNTDVATGPGKHWCILIAWSDKYAEFFDSFGLSPRYYGFHKEFLKHVQTIRYNKFPVQAPTAATCGHHCIFWTWNRIRRNSLFNIMKQYSKTNLHKNDRMVYNFVKKKFGATKAKISL